MAPTPHSHRSIDLGDGWFKSSYSSGSCTCVEVRYRNGVVQVRDGKARLDPDRYAVEPPIITVGLAEWTRLCRRLVGGARSAVAGSLVIRLAVNGSAAFRCMQTGVEQTYTAPEVAAFCAGLRAGELGGRRLLSA